MAKKIDFITIHGIGRKVNVNEYLDFINNIRGLLPKGVDVNFIQINYADDLDRKEDVIYEWMKDMGNGIRKFACYYICDVLAYAPTENSDGWYERLNKSIETVYDRTRKGSIKVLFGHSLGSQIALSLCYRRKFDLLFTAGSPVVYFSVRFKDFGLPCPVKKIVNFYNNYDLVSTKIGRNPNFKGITEDVEVKQNIFLRIPYVLPLLKRIKAHTFYWKSKAVARRIALELTKI